MVSDSLITGFMVASSAFITVTGLVLAIGRERFGKICSSLLLISLALGVAVIVLCLNWLSDTPDSTLGGWILILFQIITFYIPLFRLTSLLSSD